MSLFPVVMRRLRKNRHGLIAKPPTCVTDGEACWIMIHTTAPISPWMHLTTLLPGRHVFIDLGWVLKCCHDDEGHYSYSPCHLQRCALSAGAAEFSAGSDPCQLVPPDSGRRFYRFNSHDTCRISKAVPHTH